MRSQLSHQRLAGYRGSTVHEPAPGGPGDSHERWSHPSDTAPRGARGAARAARRGLGAGAGSRRRGRQPRRALHHGWRGDRRPRCRALQQPPALRQPDQRRGAGRGPAAAALRRRVGARRHADDRRGARGHGEVVARVGEHHVALPRRPHGLGSRRPGLQRLDRHAPGGAAGGRVGHGGAPGPDGRGAGRRGDLGLRWRAGAQAERAQHLGRHHARPRAVAAHRLQPGRLPRRPRDHRRRALHHPPRGRQARCRAGRRLHRAGRPDRRRRHPVGRSPGPGPQRGR